METSTQQHFFRKRSTRVAVFLFTVALIVLAGAALVYDSRVNPEVFARANTQLVSAALLKQSAEHRDAYNRYIFDGGRAQDAVLDVTANVGLFDPKKSYGTKQDPPLKAFDLPAAVKPPIWQISRTVKIPGVGTGKAATVAFVHGLKLGVCSQINLQLYGVEAIPPEALILTSTSLSGKMSKESFGRYTGCVATGTPVDYVFYSTLAEN
ncbi:MAG: hypothetical protein ACI8WM_003008 [Burkholderiaceae bacterium]|jgi:hypothetical protein